jgi:hypothetical protein
MVQHVKIWRLFEFIAESGMRIMKVSEYQRDGFEQTVRPDRTRKGNQEAGIQTHADGKALRLPKREQKRNVGFIREGTQGLPTRQAKYCLRVMFTVHTDTLNNARVSWTRTG